MFECEETSAGITEDEKIEKHSLKKELDSYKYFKYIADNYNEKRPFLGLNAFFCGSTFRMLLENYISICPLWSCCFGPENIPASNAEVEGHYSIIKKEMGTSKRYTYAELIKARYVQTAAEMVEIVRIVFILSYVICRNLL